jgi:hypothetical protein
MNYNFINNDAEFEQFVNSTLNYNNNRSQNRDGYELEITNILANYKNELIFTRLFAHYFINRQITNDYSYSSECCVCMDTNNYCIKICNCSEVKYCYKCFKEYVKTSILADPIKINSVINSWREQKQTLDLANLINCSICHLAPVLGLMQTIMHNTPCGSFQNPEISNYLHSLDFFSETVPSDGDFKWYLLFNQDGRIRYNLVPLELLNNIPNTILNNYLSSLQQNNENDESKLRIAGMISIFEINWPSVAEHQKIMAILKNGINLPTETTKTKLQYLNPSRLKLL